MDYFISVHPRSNVRFSALFLDKEEKSSFYPNNFPSMILQEIICVSLDTMADMNIPTNDVPAEQPPAIAPPIKTDDQILPSRKLGACRQKAFTASSTIPSIYIQQFWDTIRSVEKDGREIFSMAIPDAFLTDEIKKAPFYSEYLEHVAKYQQYLDEDHGKAKEGGVPKSPKATKVTKPKIAKQTKPSTPKAAKVTKPANDTAPKHTSSQPPKSTPMPTEPSKKDQGVPEKEPAFDDEEANLQRALKLSLKELETQGPARPVVIRELDSGRIQPLPDVQDQFIFQRCTPIPIEPFGHAESPSLDAEQALTDSEVESDKEVPGIYAGVQDEGQAGSNPGDAENLKLPSEDQVVLEEPASSTGTLSSLQNLDKELSFTNQFPFGDHKKNEPEKINRNQSSVNGLTVSTTIHAPLPTSTATVTTITTTTYLPPPPPQPQQSSFDPILLQRISELEQHMADLIQSNLALEERLDKHGSKLYNLENLNIPHKDEPSSLMRNSHYAVDKAIKHHFELVM
ncbi:retrovirus-related pol polyprotein from transposon TNT 1-94 [Tanacetum coccineum]